MKKIYLLRVDDGVDGVLYKIGITKNEVEKRVKQLQTGNGNIIEIVSVYESEYANKIETALHRGYFSNQKKGEWFSLSYFIEFNFINECKMIENNLIFIDKNKI